MNRNWKSIKVSVFSIPVPLPWVLLVLLIAAGFSLAQTRLNQGKWRTFDSGHEYETTEHPDFKIDYPATWGSESYHGYYRGIQDVWAIFGRSSVFASTGFEIYWRSMTNPTVSEVSRWGQGIIDQYRGYNVSELLEGRVGVGDYPAWIQTFQIQRGTAMMAVYIVDDESAYVLLFNAKPYNYETERIFKQILASFQILEAQG